MLGAEVAARAGDVRRQPLAVRERHEAVIAALPDRHRPGDRPDVEAPGADEREVVVEPPVDPGRERDTDLGEQVLGELARQRRAVGRPEQVAEGRRHLLDGGSGEADGHLLEERPQRRLARDRSTELLDVLGPHSRGEVEVGRVARADAGDRRRRDHAVGQERRAGERVGTAAGDAGRVAAIHPERVEDRGDVGRAVSDRAARMARAGGVAGARIAEVPEAALRSLRRRRRIHRNPCPGFRGGAPAAGPPAGRKAGPRVAARPGRRSCASRSRRGR